MRNGRRAAVGLCFAAGLAMHIAAAGEGIETTGDGGTTVVARYRFDTDAEGWWGWQRQRVPGDFAHDPEVGRAAPGSLRMDCAGNERRGLSYNRSLPVVPGGRYRIVLWTRSEALPLGAAVRLAIRWCDREEKRLDPRVFRGETIPHPYPLGPGWQRMEAVVRVPDPGDEAGRHVGFMKCSLGVVFAAAGRVWADDITIRRLPASGGEAPDAPSP